MSLDVSIFSPLKFSGDAGTAALDSSDNPEQVTVTEPAARALVTVNVILLLLKDEVDAAVGLVIAHKLLS